MNLLTVQGPKELEKFIRMPFQLYKNDDRWVPPLVSSELKMMDPKRNPFYQHSEAVHFMVEHEGRLVGRISAIDNKLHNETQKEKTGFWGYFESENDPAISGALFDAAADWLPAGHADSRPGRGVRHRDRWGQGHRAAQRDP